MPPEPAGLRPPPAPWLVLLAGIVLPGMGQVLNNMPSRGVIFVFFMLSLGVVSFHLTTPEHSFIGRHAGGFLIYVISLVDAYRFAWLRRELFAQPRPQG
jgi:hypothetical protein